MDVKNPKPVVDVFQIKKAVFKLENFCKSFNLKRMLLEQSKPN